MRSALAVMLRWSALALLVIALGAVGGCGGGGDTGQDEGATTTSSSGGGAETDSTEDPGTGGAGAMTPGAPMMPSGGPQMMGGMGGMGGGPGMGMGMGAGDTQGASGAPPKVTSKPGNARTDPFAPWWSTTPPPPPAITLVEPLRIATRETNIRPPEEKVEVQEVPNRRVAGIATGAGVYALVEGPEGQNVVRAGDMLGDYRVESIRARSIVLKRKIGNVTFTQEVPLTDIGSQRATVGTGVPGGPGGAGMMFRGGGGPMGGNMGGGAVGETAE